MNHRCIECGIPLDMPDAIGYHPDCAQKVFERENKIMRYLVTFNENGFHEAFYTEWFDIENNLNEAINMVVFDLVNHQFCSSAFIGWQEITEDHL